MEWSDILSQVAELAKAIPPPSRDTGPLEDAVSELLWRAAGYIEDGPCEDCECYHPPGSC